jgi:uncharacterized Zn-finger protein
MSHESVGQNPPPASDVAQANLDSLQPALHLHNSWLQEILTGMEAAAAASAKVHICALCGKRYQRNTHLRRHEATRKSYGAFFSCPVLSTELVHNLSRYLFHQIDLMCT